MSDGHLVVRRGLDRSGDHGVQAVRADHDLSILGDGRRRQRACPRMPGHPARPSVSSSCTVKCSRSSTPAATPRRPGSCPAPCASARSPYWAPSAGGGVPDELERPEVDRHLTSRRAVRARDTIQQAPLLQLGDPRLVDVVR